MSWRIIQDFPLQKLGLLKLKLSVLLPQHQRSGLSWVEDLPDVGGWFWRLMHCSGALCSQDPCGPLFCHSTSCLRAEYLSWSLVYVLALKCLMLPVEHSSRLCQGQTHSQRMIFRRKLKRNRSKKQNQPFAPYSSPPPLPSWSKGLKDWLKQSWIK